MIYRRLEAQDYPAYEALRYFALDYAPSAFGSSNVEEKEYREKRFMERVNHSDHFILGAFDEGELVGIVGFLAHQRIKTKHKGDLISMFVDPESHGKGIGSALVKMALEEAFSYPQICKIDLSVEANNSAAIALYRKMGFEEWGRERDALRIGEEFVDLIYMGRQK